MADLSADLNKMKVPELKQALKEKGLPVSGTKPELIKRLGEALGAAVDTTNDGLEDSLQGIDDILDDDTLAVTGKRASEAKAIPTSPTKEVKAQKPDTVSSNGVTEKADASKKSAADTTVAGKPAEASKLSDAERLKMRAEKFGVTSVEAKKEQRAQRFGLPASGSGTPKQTADELERMKKRADRFGTVVSTSLTKIDEEERKRKRAERFGGTTDSSTVKKVTSVDKSITDLDNEAKKRKRAERFGIAT